MDLTLNNHYKMALELYESGPGEFTKAYNGALVASIRANRGRAAGEMERFPFLLLTTKGARSGVERTVPLGALNIEDRLLVIASMGGSPRHPAWYHNLLANPEVTIEMNGETFRAIATNIEGEERTRLYGVVCKMFSAWSEYEKRTDRVIPVVELTRI